MYPSFEDVFPDKFKFAFLRIEVGSEVYHIRSFIPITKIADKIDFLLIFNICIACLGIILLHCGESTRTLQTDK